MNETVTVRAESTVADAVGRTVPKTLRGRAARIAARAAVAGPWRGVVEKLVFRIGHRFPTNAAVLKVCRHFGYALMEREGTGFERVAIFESGGRMHWGRGELSSPMCALFYFIGNIAAQGGEDETFVARLLTRALKAGDVFFDIGANVGFYSCFAAPLCGKSGAVHLFEANPYLICHLRRCAALNASVGTMIVNDIAVGKEADRTVELFDPEWVGSSSLFRQAWLNTASSVSVRVTTIDKYRQASGVQRLDVVKLDIEGGELDALQGMVETLAACPPALIVCELASQVAWSRETETERGSRCYPLEIMEFLGSRGYEARHVSDDGCLGRRVERDDVERMPGKTINVAFVRSRLEVERPELFCSD